MKIQNIKVRGAIGFKKGLGVDEIELDLSGISGLIALAGQNGKGKTTLLESLSPFRTFASRAGALRHHFFLRNSFRDLSFEYDGHLYRTLVKVDADSERSEGFIWKDGFPEIDGKVTSYNTYLVKLLGTANLFYNSVFCAQNSAKISDMTTGQLKQLFVEFLRLDRLTGYENSAKKCIGLLDGMRLQEERGIAALNEKIGQFGDIEQQLKSAVESEKCSVEIKAANIKGLNDVEAAIEKLKDTLAQNKVNIERRDDLNKDITEISTSKDIKEQETHAQHDEIAVQLDTLKQDVSKYKLVTDKKDQILGASKEAKRFEEEISSATKALEETETKGRCLAEEISTGETRQNELTRAIMDLEKDPGIYGLECQLNEVVSIITDINNDFDKLTREEADTRQSFPLIKIETEIKTCKEAMALLEERDPACQSNTCSFIVSALKAAENLPKLEAEKLRLQDEIKKACEEIGETIKNNRATLKTVTERKNAVQKDLDAERLAITEKKTGLKEKRRLLQEATSLKKTARENLVIGYRQDKAAIDALKISLEAAKILATQLPQVEIAEAKLSEILKKTEEAKEKKTSITLEFEKFVKEKDAKLADLLAKKAEIDGKINLNAEQDISTAEQLKTQHINDIKALDDKISTIREQASILRQKLQEKEHAEKDLAAKKAEYDRLKSETHQWTYLRDACSKNGLQALEIDGVAPLVAGYANDLLAKSFGPNFSVKLVTQNEETGRETLDIVVIRGDGSETLLENLSGGEKVWILKALRLAMTLVSKEKSGRNFESFLADEEDGPLDSEKAQSFIGLYRSMMDVGKFRDCFYISHNPDVVAMADHQILFSKSGIQVG